MAGRIAGKIKPTVPGNLKKLVGVKPEDVPAQIQLQAMVIVHENPVRALMLQFKWQTNGRRDAGLCLRRDDKSSSIYLLKSESE